ncbi:GNAT family N-acetyltransferase [Alkalihalobacterium chitinilyticum]|uniref:N-acetyltransferase n=1 Tax=Alkalihalobacterium chitinilyticum TaxID=2980103 RepID=A0ABT5VE87_9BACI|nr:N-acetyltransferase [Alkalihalobacterium chitinilyticum]MDE5413642.1 N-acetyltransferase [Alkalihalobacterium chitinilyticum]
MKNQIQLVSDFHSIKNYMKDYPFHPSLNRFREAKEQQKALLATLENGSRICIATDKDWIVGYTLILAPEENERWSALPYIKVLGAIEVAPSFRSEGIAKKLLHGICDEPQIEQFIILSIEYAWHWDLHMVNENIEVYKALLKRLLQTQHFNETVTDDPDVAQYKHNFMMARFGKQVSSDQINQFMRLANINSIF